MEEQGLGFRFYARMAGVVIAAGIALLILAVLFDWAAYTWGFFGVLIVVVAGLLLVAWLIDRKKIREYEAE
jgi:hypothetical protein